MKKYKYLIAALAAVALGLSVNAAFAVSPVSSGASYFPMTLPQKVFNNPTDAVNQIVQLGNAQLVGSALPTSLLGNPLAESYSSALVPGTDFSSAATKTLIASQAGVTLRPTAVSLMVSGTAATATGIALECSDGTLIASWPIAELVDQVPAGMYKSTAGPALGAGLSGKGCAASTAILLSNIGSTITTTTVVYPNVIYSER
jgi:hypothetical protein